jgi:hypothetical protein
MSECEAFEYNDGFLDMRALLAQVSEHLQQVHTSSITQCAAGLVPGEPRSRP